MTTGWASPAILGLLVFGLTVMLVGLWNLPKPYGNGFGVSEIAFAAYAAAGLLAFVGVILLFEGRLFWGSAFLGYGTFFATWGYALHHAGFVSGYGIAGFLFLWMMFTLTFLVSSIKHGWATLIAFLFLFVGIILLLVVAWQTGAGNTISSGEHWAVGGELIATGLIWWYGGTAQLTNHSFAKKFLPV